jgi:hypothetical protein
LATTPTTTNDDGGGASVTATTALSNTTVATNDVANATTSVTTVAADIDVASRSAPLSPELAQAAEIFLADGLCTMLNVFTPAQVRWLFFVVCVCCL